MLFENLRLKTPVKLMTQTLKSLSSFHQHTSTLLRTAIISSLIVIVSACTVSPLDGKVLSSTNTSVPVVGFWAYPSQALQLLASPTPDGPWSVIRTVTTNSSPSYYGGRKLYSFNTRVSIDESLWRIPPSACAAQETYFGIATASTTTPVPALISLEEEYLSGVNPFSCLDDNNYDASQCASRRSPITRLLVGSQITRHVGDVIIGDNIDHAEHRCYDTIDGNLVIEDSVGEIDMPELRNITGDLILDYPVYAEPSSPHIGRIVQRHFPLLTHVDGDLSAISRGPATISGPSISYTQRRLNPDMPMLQRIGGDLSMFNVGLNDEKVGANGYFHGLSALSYIGGDLRFSDHADRYFGTLGSVRRIEGNLFLGRGKANGSLLNELDSIGGNLEIPKTRVKTEILANLKRIEGDALLSFHWVASAATSMRNLESLEYVGGTLALTNSSRSAFAMGVRPISVGQLAIENNHSLTNISPSEIDIRDNGDMRIVDNVNLCTTTIQRLMSANRLAGWLGNATISGNGSC